MILRNAVPACALLLGSAIGAGAQAYITNNAHEAAPATQTDASLPAPAVTMPSGADTLHIPVGRSVLLTSAAPLRRLYVGDPTVLGTFTSGASEIVLTARQPGVSSMVLWDQAGGHRIYSVFADLDPVALRASIEDAFPAASIHINTGEGRVFLTGTVATDAASDAAAKLAAQYSKDVINSLRVVPEHGRQVQLKLRIVEVDRTRAQQLGINLFAQGRTPFATTTGQFPSTASGSGTSLAVSNPLDIFLYNAKLNVGLTVQDLEQKQVLQVLAEPTLTTLSGVPARFLSGGEFPFPVAQASAGSAPTITIQFRPYGVKVDFTPTVGPDGSIHIKLAPEVSTLDFANAVTLSGFTIPAISTRRAETEVEIKAGQSFAVSGLLDHRTTESLSKVPGIGDIPVLGQLFRSRNVNHSVVELVILVTATVVNPLDGSSPNQTGVTQPVEPLRNLDPAAFDASLLTKAGKAPVSSAPAPQIATPQQIATPPQPEAR
jgi:pilus assembly protein CpaC